MPTALASRFIHHYMKVNSDEWVEWATAKGSVLPEVIAYILRNPGSLHDFNANAEEKAYPCPRSWEILTRRLSAFGLDESADVLIKRVAGVIGYGHATNFLAFLKYRSKLVLPEDIIKDPLKAKIHSPRELDAMYITATSLNVYMVNNPTLKGCLAAIKYISREEFLPEIGALVGRHVVANVVNRNRLSPADRKAFSSSVEVSTYIKNNQQDLAAMF
jgi:hypothetical protein